MERDEFVAIVEPLALAMRADFDQPMWTAYFRALEDVPAPLLASAVDVMLREAIEWFPKAGELRARAERQRRVLLAAHPHEACCDCEHSKGWRAVLVDGVPKVQRCPCVERYKAKLAMLGLSAPIAQLTGESGAGDVTDYPTLDQLPAPVRAQLQAVAGQKVLR